MASVLIAGCGYIGQQLAGVLQQNGQSVSGLVRSSASYQQLIDSDIVPVLADLDGLSDDCDIATRDHEIYYFAPPPANGLTDPRVAGFCQHMISAGLPGKLVYISTSAVYGDCEGRWIDESAPLRPGTDRGKRRLDAEQTLLTWGRNHAVPVVILRVPGIYGPGKLPIARLEKGLPVLRAEDSPYTNRIHASDLVQICLHAMRYGQSGEAYNVSDGNPTTMCDYFQQIAQQLDLPAPSLVDLKQAQTVLSPGMLAFLGESKRLINHKLLTQLRVTLRYPELASGLEASIN